ncbi:MAG: FAD:protein FMN transferase [Clostridia bacterium]|nr:FAD:protein FMN transferase [Clostridia bacterium]
MKKSITLFVALCLFFSALSMTACEQTESGVHKELEKFSAYSFDYFDTVTTISGYAESKEAFDAVANDALAQLGEYHRLFTIYHRFEGLENLCTINELVDGQHRTVSVDARIIDMLLYAKEMHALTDGHVNIAMGSVLSIWHEYRTIGMDDPVSAELPPMEKLQEAAKHTDIDHLVIDEQNCTVTITDPQMKLDVGAVAKGYAVEMIAQALEAQGVTGYVLNVGGNVRTIGTKADGNPWTVGLENPLDEGEDYICYLGLAGQTLVTSGSYQRYYFVNGKQYHHIIHQDTLMPAEGFVSVSVLTKHSGMADALSTALFCMTLEQGRALAQSLPDTEVLWVLPDGTRHSTDGWSAYMIDP